MSARQRKVDKVISLLRSAIPQDELDDSDWESFRVAARIVYETEELGIILGRKVTHDRIAEISAWSDSIEGAITFMSWVKELAQIVSGMTYARSVPVDVDALWRRHRRLAERLLAPKLAPAKRLSVLVQLGGIEVSLWGQTWALEPKWLRPAAAALRRQIGQAPGNVKKIPSTRSGSGSIPPGLPAIRRRAPRVHPASRTR